MSVIPLLSRILERLVARAFVYPSFCVNPMVEMIRGQLLYSFLPADSTKAALVELFQKLTDEYVALVTVNFSGAFDCVNHLPLMLKMSLLDLPDCIL